MQPQISISQSKYQSIAYIFRHDQMSAKDSYQKRIERFKSELVELEAKSSKASNTRMLTFFGAIGALLIAFNAPLPQPITLALYAIGILLLPVFVAVVLSHRKVSETIERAEYLKQLNTESIARLSRDWDNFPVPPTPVEFKDHPTARDLDLFGKASLFHLSNTAITPGGRERLSDWLSNPALPEVASARQPAVQELAPALDWRQELCFAGHDLKDRDESANTMPVRKDEKPWIEKNTVLNLLSRVLPLAFFVLLIAQFGGFTAIPWWLFPVIITAVLTKVFSKKLEHTLGDIRREELALQAYTSVFAKLDELEPKSAWLTEQHNKIEGAHKAVEELCNYATSNAARGSIVYPLLQYGLMWDFHVARGVERWHSRHAEKVPGWFDALAQIEAAASLASLHHDEPDWIFPEFSNEKTIISKDLGHPLIESAARVSNDLTIDPPGNFLLVTGSNMSGKSTLLRSLGLNLTLAQAGAPTCTSAFQLPPLHIVTSLRVEDSLTEGVSFFMAELKRIKGAVQLADKPPEGRTILYLFDEILRGTNSVERQAIVQRLIGHLLKKDAIGAVTTHDPRTSRDRRTKARRQSSPFPRRFRRHRGRPQNDLRLPAPRWPSHHDQRHQIARNDRPRSLKRPKPPENGAPAPFNPKFTRVPKPQKSKINQVPLTGSGQNARSPHAPSRAYLFSSSKKLVLHNSA